MEDSASFISFDKNKGGLVFDQSMHELYPLRYYNLTDSGPIEIENGFYGFCYAGSILRWTEELHHRYEEGASSMGGAIIIEVLNKEGVYPETGFEPYNLMGGPIEDKGRLKYIDGCTDSLLIPPIKLGDPCLNHLHFPKGIDQTPHTHPSHRIGIVAKGEGECITPFGNLPLTEGMIFVIKEHDGVTQEVGLDGNMYPTGTHSFKTTNNSMDVIAFHPDSDFGPTDINHPMINRTIVGGVSASTLEDIRTK
jgi:hypothetical protein